MIVLHRLSAILLPIMNEPVRLFHPSFPEFIVDAARCIDLRFRLDPGESHPVPAARCLIIMNNQLKQDICDIHDPTRTNSTVSDLPERLEKSVSPELRYAAIYWMHHVTSAFVATADVFDALTIFCDDHILHWLELLSLLKQLLVASKGLPGLLRWVEASEFMTVTILRETDSMLRDTPIRTMLEMSSVYFKTPQTPFENTSSRSARLRSRSIIRSWCSCLIVPCSKELLSLHCQSPGWSLLENPHGKCNLGLI
jgi:hypothetical protein